MNLKLDTSDNAVVYNIDAVFVTAILYGDTSALSGSDVDNLDEFLSDIDSTGHGGCWEFPENIDDASRDNFERCDISGLASDVVEATYTPYIPA